MEPEPNKAPCIVCAQQMTPHKFRGRNGRWVQSKVCGPACATQLKAKRSVETAGPVPTYWATPGGGA